MKIVWHKLRRLIGVLALVSLIVPAPPAMAENHAGGGNEGALHSPIHAAPDFSGLAGERADDPAAIDCCAFLGAETCAMQGAGCCAAGANALFGAAFTLATDSDPGPVAPRGQNCMAARSLASDPPPPRI